MPKVSVGLAELPTTPHFLYRFYDRTDTLLYIGITMDPKARFKWHRKNQPWWTDVDHSKTRIECLPTREAALDAERKAIAGECPLYNDQHNLTVDTPTNSAMAEAVRKSADVLLHHMCNDGEDYEAALLVGREAVEAAELEEEGEDELAGQDPVLVAAELKAMSLSSNSFLFRQSVQTLMDVMPDEDVARWMDAARTWAQHSAEQYEDPKTEDETLRHVLRVAAMGAATGYLETLPAPEAAEWRKAAKNFLSQWATADVIDLEAALYAKTYKVKGWYGGAYHMCRHEGRYGAACPEKATISFVYEDCPMCDPKSCKGHLESCDDHREDRSSAGKVWTRTGRPVVVAWAGVKPPSTDPWDF